MVEVEQEEVEDWQGEQAIGHQAPPLRSWSPSCCFSEVPLVSCLLQAARTPPAVCESSAELAVAVHEDAVMMIRRERGSTCQKHSDRLRGVSRNWQG